MLTVLLAFFDASNLLRYEPAWWWYAITFGVDTIYLDALKRRALRSSQ